MGEIFKRATWGTVKGDLIDWDRLEPGCHLVVEFEGSKPKACWIVVGKKLEEKKSEIYPRIYVEIPIAWIKKTIDEILSKL